MLEIWLKFYFQKMIENAKAKQFQLKTKKNIHYITEQYLNKITAQDQVTTLINYEITTAIAENPAAL
jgi:hypothetical protein